jgi:hypothetical protein
MIEYVQCNKLATIIHIRMLLNLLVPPKKNSKRIYAALSPPEIAPAPMRWIWKSCVMPKHNFLCVAPLAG